MDQVIFACLDFRDFVILGLFTKSRIYELSISMIESAYNNKFHKIIKFANLASLRKLKPREYYQIYSIWQPPYYFFRENYKKCNDLKSMYTSDKVYLG